MSNLRYITDWPRWCPTEALARAVRVPLPHWAKVGLAVAVAIPASPLIAIGTLRLIAWGVTGSWALPPGEAQVAAAFVAALAAVVGPSAAGCTVDHVNR